MECIGDVHDHDSCPEGCAQEHAYCFVRVAPTRTTAPAARRARRRLDLAVDLHRRFRVHDLGALLSMTLAELEDAWVLLEPRDDEDSCR